MFQIVSDISPKKMEWYGKEPPNISEYIEKRFIPSVEWYERKAHDNMLRFHIFQILIIIAAIFIPIVNVVPLPGSNSSLRIISSILGGIIVGITSILQLTKSQESWIIFRETAENLKNEYQLYSHQTANYSDENITGSSLDDKQAQRNKLFVRTVESIMRNETTTYLQKRSEKPAAPGVK